MVHPCCGFRLLICTRVIGGIDIALAIGGIIRFTVKLSKDDCPVEKSQLWAYYFCGVVKILQCMVLIGLAIVLFKGVSGVFILGRSLVALVPLVLFCLCDLSLQVDQSCRFDCKKELIVLLSIFCPYTAYVLWVVHVFSGLIGRDAAVEDPDGQYLPHGEIEAFFFGSPKSEDNDEQEPFPKEFRIPEKKLHVDHKKLVGVGTYGTVVQGSLQTPGSRNLVVAVKIIKPNLDLDYLRAELEQLKRVTKVGSHLHIVSCLGAVTDKIAKGRLSLVFEYCEGGSLETFLNRNKTGFVNQVNGDRIDRRIRANPYINSPFTEWASQFNTVDLIRWAFQISKGMKFLASKQVIHGDLSTRTILLTENKTAKISDFGLSCKLYEYTEYVKRNQVPPRWRTMAMESLRDMKFTGKSDVCSFGTTLWEMFSLGEVSSPELSWSLDFALQVCERLRLSKPKFATSEIYNAMLECWKLEPKERPDFEDLRLFFANTLSYLND